MGGETSVRGKVSIEYEHKKAGKVISKGYSYGDWIGFTHLVQVYPGFKMTENIFDQTGRLFKTKTYKGISFLGAKIIQFLVKRR